MPEKPGHKLRIKSQHGILALELGPTPQLGLFLSIRPGGGFFIVDSSFVGKVALELGPAPHVVTFFNSQAAFSLNFAMKTANRPRNGSGINENQHEPYHPARNFGASPAATTRMRQDP